MSDSSNSPLMRPLFDRERSVFEIVTEGEPGAVVVVPPDGALDEAAARIVQAVYDRYGVTLDVVGVDRASRELPTPHAIALGCLADNPYIESLYARWNTLVDRWYPGTGGHVLQMVLSPFQQGHHALILGGSDRDGVEAACGRFSQLLESSDDGYFGWLLEVRLGASHSPLPEDRMDVLGMVASPVTTPESLLPDSPYRSAFTGGSVRDHLLRLGMYGPHADNYHFSRSAQFGLRYLYTGRSEGGEAYRETLLNEVRTGVLRELYHYKSLRMFQLWTLLCESPVFSPGERNEISNAIYDYLMEESGVANVERIQNDSCGEEILNRHVACDALNLWSGTDWLWRKTGEAIWLEQRSIADRYFESQAGTDVPLTGLTEGYARYLEVVLEWMLLSCPGRIESDSHIRQWAERVMGLCTNTGHLVVGPQTDESRYPHHLLRKLAFLLDDGRCLFVANLREQQVHRGNDRLLQFSAGQAYAADVEALQPGTGLTVHPMNERLRMWKAPTIAKGKGFDRVVGRNGWETADDYLMLIGVRSGGKSLPNVGALAAYERFGQRLITSDMIALFPGCASPWRHSTATANVGGLGAGMVEGAEILADEEIAGGHLVSLQMKTPTRSWVRTLFWKPGAYVLVTDRIVSDSDEALTQSVNWRCGGDVRFQH